MTTPHNPQAAHTWASATYPLLLIRLGLAQYHLRPLAAELGRAELMAMGWAAMDACKRRYRMCVLFSPTEGVYLEPDGQALENRELPRGGMNPRFFPPELEFLSGTTVPTQAKVPVEDASDGDPKRPAAPVKRTGIISTHRGELTVEDAPWTMTFGYFRTKDGRPPSAGEGRKDGKTDDATSSPGALKR